MFLLSTQGWAIVMLLICVIPIAALILFALIVRIKKAIKSKSNQSVVEENDSKEQFEVFVNALGGNENYLSSSIERNKISFKLNDTSLVDGEKLKELGASGVLIVGDEVRASFGDRAQYVYNIIKKEN